MKKNRRDDMRGRRYPPEEYDRRGKEWYQRVIRPKVEAGNKGRLVVIDIETGEYEVGDNGLTAAEALYARLPNAQPYCVRIGYKAVHAYGGQRLPEDDS
jgi:hypothetical protein